MSFTGFDPFSYCTRNFTLSLFLKYFVSFAEDFRIKKSRDASHNLHFSLYEVKGLHVKRICNFRIGSALFKTSCIFRVCLKIDNMEMAVVKFIRSKNIPRSPDMSVCLNI